MDSRMRRYPRLFVGAALAVAASAAVGVPAGGAARTDVVPDHLAIVIAAPAVVGKISGGPRSVDAGGSFRVRVFAMDASNNYLTSYNGPATWSDLSGSLAPTSPSDFVHGVSTTTGVTITSPFHLDRLSVTTSGVTSQSKTFNVLGPLDHLAVGIPLQAHSATDFTVNARALDTANNLLTSYSGPATWADLSGTLAPTTPSDFVNGVSSTTIAQIPDAQHADRITVDSGGVNGQSNPFNVFGPITQIQVYGPPAVVHFNGFYDITAKARDAAGNLVTDYDAPATWSDHVGGLNPKAPNDFVNGVSFTNTQIGGDTTKGDVITIVSGTATGDSRSFDIIS